MVKNVWITSKGGQIDWETSNPDDPIPSNIQDKINAESVNSFANMAGIGDERETHEAAYDHTALVSESHSHTNKTQLDLLTDGDHDVRTDNPHSVTKAQVGLTNVPDLDTTDAVNNEHIQITNARTLYVDKNGNDTTGDGTVGNPYQTIGAAVTQAKTMSPVHNAQVSIVIGPGFYNEHVIIDKDGISLYGYGQNVTQVERAGTCLTHKINDADYPWDAKVVGISFRSTTADFSVRVEGAAGSSIAGDEIQYRDCRIAGTNSFYATTANYLDFQNTYVMGAVQIVNCAGCWVEQSQWDGSITIDYNPANDEPSDTGNYGIYLMTAINGSITLLNNGKIGEDRRILKLSDYVGTPFTPTTGGNWTTIPDTIQKALDELASRIKVLEP